MSPNPPTARRPPRPRLRRCRAAACLAQVRDRRGATARRFAQSRGADAWRRLVQRAAIGTGQAAAASRSARRAVFAPSRIGQRRAGAISNRAPQFARSGRGPGPDRGGALARARSQRRTCTCARSSRLNVRAGAKASSRTSARRARGTEAALSEGQREGDAQSRRQRERRRPGRLRAHRIMVWRGRRIRSRRQPIQSRHPRRARDWHAEETDHSL